MGIDAVVLLQGKDLDIDERLRHVRLEDATLVYSSASFSAEPEELAGLLEAELGEALEAHSDERGVFVLPSVARPEARTYEGVVEEIGEAGMWLPISESAVAAAPAGMPGDLGAMLGGLGSGGFGALVGEIMSALGPEALAEMQRAVLTGDFEALARMQGKITEAMGGEEALAARSEELQKAAEEGSALAQKLASQVGGDVDLDGLLAGKASPGKPGDEEP